MYPINSKYPICRKKKQAISVFRFIFKINLS